MFRPAFILAAVLTFAAGAFAQQMPAAPRVGYIYPAGGQQGTTFEVTAGGRMLDGASLAQVSGYGVKVAVVEHIKPPNGAQAQTLRERLRELQKQRQAAMRPRAATRPFTAADAREVADILRKLGLFQKAMMTPALAESVTLKVTIAPNAEPGLRELRLVTRGGLTNPIAFCVGQLPEVRERDSVFNKTRAETATTLPATVNGQIMPSDVDRYRFKARKGQRLVFIASARELIPYLPDAVPGWFQATLALYDARGNELAYADDWRYNPDPVLFYEIPADSDYALEIRDSIYRGRDDFVYRISIGELPFITGVFPLGGRAGQTPSVEVTGWNLPAAKLSVDTRAPGILPVNVRKGTLVSNRVPFAVDSLPELLEREPNNTESTAQAVTLPAIVNGRIDKPGDWDVYSFEGRAGDKVVAEVYARRLNSPIDSVLRLTDARGKQVALNDDHEDKATGLQTHHADSYIGPTTLPTTGTYYVHIGDTQRQGGSEFAYRLRMSAPRPDFSLRVVPSSVIARAGTNVPVTVYAIREDGFGGEIAIALKDAPAGMSLGGAIVPAGQDKVRLTLRVPAPGQKEPLALTLEGRAKIQGLLAVRPGVPAEDMMQAFAYRHLVPASEMMVEVLPGFGGRGARPGPRILSPTPVRIPSGGTARVVLGIPAATLLGKVSLELADPPEGITIRSVNTAREGIEVVLACDAKIKPGLKGNLIASAFLERDPPKTATTRPAAPAARRRVPLNTLPAIPFEVTAR